MCIDFFSNSVEKHALYLGYFCISFDKIMLFFEFFIPLTHGKHQKAIFHDNSFESIYFDNSSLPGLLTPISPKIFLTQ